VVRAGPAFGNYLQRAERQQKLSYGAELQQQMALQQAQRKAEKLERMGIQGGGLASVGSDMLMGGPQQAPMGLAVPALSMPAMGSFGVQPSGGSFGAPSMPPPAYQPPVVSTMAPSPFMSQPPGGQGYGPPPPTYGMPGGPGMYGGQQQMPQPMMPVPAPISIPPPGGAYPGGPGSFGAGGGPGSPTAMGGFGGPSPNSYAAGKKAHCAH
jgi:hypothetical protein